MILLADKGIAPSVPIDDVIAPSRPKRDLTSHEQKVDYRHMQVEDAIALQGGRIRMGIILAAQMESLVEWVRSKQFTPARLSRIPERVLLANEIKREFLRNYLRSYFDGAEAYALWKDAHIRSMGLVPRDREAIVTFGDDSIRWFSRFADRLGTAAIHAIEARIMPILESSWTPTGKLLKSMDQIEGEIRSVYANNLIERAEVPRGADILLLARRRMKIRNREQYDAWQRQKVPYSRFIKQSAADIRAGKLPPQLSRHLAVRWLRTERTRFYTHSMLDQVRDDPDAVWLQFSAGGNACPVCQARDGVIRRKDDDYWGFNTPPLHHGCTDCRIVPIFSNERVHVTPKKDLPAQDDVPDGYGLYDPKKVQDARRLGIKPPAKRQRKAA